MNTEYAILPLRQMVIYPGAVLPLSIGRQATLRLVEEAIEQDKQIVLVLQKNSETDPTGADDLYDIGCLAKIVKHVYGDGNNISLVVQGLERVTIKQYIQTEPYFIAEVEILPDTIAEETKADKQLIDQLKEAARKILSYLHDLPESAVDLVNSVDDPAILTDLIAAQIDGPKEDKQKILECVTVNERVHQVLDLVQRQLEILQINTKISDKVQGSLNKNQREYYLKQQLKAIKEELGEDADDAEDYADLENTFNTLTLPEEVEKVVKKELKRLHHMNPMQSEYTVARNYIECLMEMPWDKQSEDRFDLDEVRAILDHDHYGLDKIKKRIIEFLAVRKLKKDMKGPILCFVGPPGVGKTSLGRSIAKAMGREFVTASMGGLRDEAEIRGHRRTYVGAMPGRIAAGMKKAGTINPVFVLDEIDKLAHDVRGDPASALLEVLDPEQNNSFSDHYLNVSYDLSKVFFITTANQLETIPIPLRDRMEILELPGYTIEEKIHIAKHHLIPRQLEAHGLAENNLQIPDDSLQAIISTYTREAGVRNLNRQIAAICRFIAVKVVDGDTALHNITVDTLEEILGKETYYNEMADRTEIPGVATGLAWTATGGEILFVEATFMKGKGNLTITGQLGEVMKESAQAALSYTRSQAKELGINEDIFEKSDIHIHVPAGAIPKDGPSAGVTMFTALVSMFTKTCIHSDIAMSGEITLRGAVLPVGGIKEKVLAAKRAGVKRIILPERNRKDLVDIPEESRNDLEFIFVSHVNDVLKAALNK